MLQIFIYETPGCVPCTEKKTRVDMSYTTAWVVLAWSLVKKCWFHFITVNLSPHFRMPNVCMWFYSLTPLTTLQIPLAPTFLSVGKGQAGEQQPCRQFDRIKGEQKLEVFPWNGAMDQYHKRKKLITLCTHCKPMPRTQKMHTNHQSKCDCCCIRLNGGSIPGCRCDICHTLLHSWLHFR